MNIEQLLYDVTNAASDMNTFYKQKFVNYRGKNRDWYYLEIIAKYLLENMYLFDKIRCITREESYRIDSHNGDYDITSNREEEIIAMDMYNQSSREMYSFSGIGKVIDYQTPLKNKRSDVAGKIDLLSYDGNILRILELKKETSEETMLRCVLEGFTYLRTVNHSKLLSDFSLPEGTPVKASPLVFVNSIQYEEYFAERPYLRELMKNLDCEPYFIKKVKEHHFEVVSVEN